MKVRCAHDALIDIRALKPHPKNRNKHPEDQIVRLAKILEYQGWRYPVKVSNLSGFITSGHGRLLAAKHLGWTQVPVNYQDYDSEEQEYADVQADNAIASWAELDLSGINGDIGALGPDFDIDLLGLRDFSIEPADKEGQGDPDEVPKPAKPIVQPGEMYILGEHRLLCGDSTDPLMVSRLMNGEKADMVFTDPPYGIALNTDYSGKKGGKVYRPIENDTDATECVKAILRFDCRKVIWGANNFYWMLPEISQAGWITWDKRCSEAADKAIGSPFELAWTDKQKHFQMCRVQHGGAINHDYRHGGESQYERFHPSQKPVELAKQVFERFEGSGLVVDLFLGSGSTLIACEKTKRRCFGMEIDPVYCGVILDRWAKFTGKDPHREDGTPWSIIKANGQTETKD